MDAQPLRTRFRIRHHDEFHHRLPYHQRPRWKIPDAVGHRIEPPRRADVSESAWDIDTPRRRGDRSSLQRLPQQSSPAFLRPPWPDQETPAATQRTAPVIVGDRGSAPLRLQAEAAEVRSACCFGVVLLSAPHHQAQAHVHGKTPVRPARLETRPFYQRVVPSNRERFVERSRLRAGYLRLTSQSKDVALA